MKYSLLLLSVSFGLLQSLMSQVPLEASSQAVTVTLTGKEQMPGYSEKDSSTNETTYTTDLSSTKENADGNPTSEVEGYKMNSVAYKVGNKEILRDALGEGVSIAGWSLVYEDGALIATKKNEENVTIDSLVLPDVTDSIFTRATLSTTNYSYNKEGENTSTTQTYSDSGTYEGPVAVTYDGAEMIGYLAGVFKASTWYETTTDDNDKTILDKSSVQSVVIPGALRITNLSGSIESDNGSKIFTGSISFAPATVRKASAQ